MDSKKAAKYRKLIRLAQLDHAAVMYGYNPIRPARVVFHPAYARTRLALNKKVL